ncbi:ammonium transporter [Nicoliella spurrieriana]|uniref:Ammonium transporter n=1 Tax=Nicoliella spurrieriana TaxID=2925830 RepID=A0A976RSS1_9LACO|nr:ammonium transporter [Nicoliella spurrieriana]UQS87172.1 ammonium transporter [Nicoliella spurrieriana]
MSLGSTVFVLISAILVLLMTPGLAFFYGGLVSKKNVVNTMFLVFIMTGMVALMWVIFGYGFSFVGNGAFIGDFKHFFLSGIDLNSLQPSKIPTGVYMLFQMMFAIITPGLFIGAIVGRTKLKFILLFIFVWSIVVYYPMVHMVWSSTGFLAKMGTLDFAGGTVIHINAGVTAFVLAKLIGKRLNYGKPFQAYSVPLVLIGTTLLWIGWYGFNAGSALAMNDVAMQAAVTTTVATGASMMTWFFLDVIFNKQASLMGVCTGTLCGLVGITPATGFVTVAGSFWIGIIATIASFAFINYVKPRIGLDDTLDAFGCHGISGMVGSIATGLFASKLANPSIADNGLFYGGGFHQVGVQLIATCFTIVFVAIAAYVIAKVIGLITPMRATKEEEIKGMDLVDHGEMADDSVHTE